MELQEKIAFARENPVYDAIPLIVLHKAEKKSYNETFIVQREDLAYYVSSPFWMKCRLLLFWMLWTVLLIAMIISFLTYFCFIPRTCYQIDRDHGTHKSMDMNR